MKHSKIWIVLFFVLVSACAKTTVFDAKISFSRLAKSENPEFTGVNEEFSDERNAENGVFAQRLVSESCRENNSSEIRIISTKVGLVTIQNKYISVICNINKGNYIALNNRTGDTCFKSEIIGVNKEKVTRDNKWRWSEVNFSDSLGKCKTIRIFSEGDQLSHIQDITLYENHDFIVVNSGVKNMSNNPVRINYLHPFSARVFDGIKAEKHYFLDGNSGKIPTKVKSGDSLKCRNNLLLTITDKEKLYSFVTGGLTYNEFDRFAQIKKDNNSFKIDVWSYDPVGKLVDPGELYVPDDKVYVSFTESNPLDALEKYGNIVKQAQNVNLNLYDFPTVCLWYNDFYGDTSMGNHSAGAVAEMQQIKESGFLEYSRAAVRLVPDMYALINQQGWWDDEHWQRKNIFEHRGRAIESGHYKEPYETTRKWAQAVINLGGIPLTYIQPGMRNIDFAEAHPEYMLFNSAHAPKLDENGDTVFISKTHWQKHLRGTMLRHSYDYTDTGFLNHLEKVYENLDTSGIKGLMFDFPDMAWAEEGGMDNPYSTTAAAYLNIYKTARKGLGPAAYLHERNIKRGSDITLGLVSSHRIMGDNDKINPTLTGRGGLRWYKNRTLINYDMDAKNLYVTSPDNRDGRRAMLTMTYVTSGRFLMANSFSSLKNDSSLYYDFTRIFPFHQEHKSARPVDAFTGKVVPEVFDFVVDSSWHLVTFYNSALDSGNWAEWGQTFHLPNKGKQVSSEMSINMSGEPGFGALGLNKDKSYYVYDFWNNNFIGKVKGNQELRQRLRPGEARMLSIHEAVNHPQFISTNRHIMQGLVDMIEIPQWDNSDKTLSGTSIVVAGDEYEIVIANNGFVPIVWKTNNNTDIKTQEIKNDLTLVFISSRETQPVEWKIKFIKN